MSKFILNERVYYHDWLEEQNKAFDAAMKGHTIDKRSVKLVIKKLNKSAKLWGDYPVYRELKKKLKDYIRGK